MEFVVALQDDLHLASHVVVAIAHDLGGQDVRRRRQRVNRRVDTQSGDLTGELRRGVEVGEGRERCGVGVVVRRDVHGLQRRNGLPSGRGDALLELTHLIGESRLVAHGRRHTAKQGRDLRSGLNEPEDVVHEQQHVLVLDISEILGHGQGSERHAQPHTRGLVHLTEDQCHLLDDARLLHLDPEVGTLTGALANAGEH